MKIYVCQQSFDNDCGIFSDKQKAIDHFAGCNYCAIQEYEDLDGTFTATEWFLFKWTCVGCGIEFRSDEKKEYTGYPITCSPKCLEDYELRCQIHKAERAAGLHSDECCTTNYDMKLGIPEQPAI